MTNPTSNAAHRASTTGHGTRPALRLVAGLSACLFSSSLALADGVQFEELATGEIVSSVTSMYGTGPIYVSGYNSRFPEKNSAVIFDTANPSGGDQDLGTPNSDFGGPGQGSGGSQGSPNQNDTLLGKVLIIAEDLVLDDQGRVADPDDEANNSGILSFDYTALGTVTLHTLQYMDVEESQIAVAKLYDSQGNSLGIFDLPGVGNNGVNFIDLGSVVGVASMDVHLGGSGAVTAFEFDVDCGAKLGDLVWNDLDGDGLQDDGEPGIPGVTLQLLDGSNQVIDSAQTNDDGEYAFTNQCSGLYTVVVDLSTLPDGFVASPCQVGNDAEIDNNCSPASVQVAGLDRLDLDFGFTPVPFTYCESLPNSSGGNATMNAGGETSLVTNNFEVLVDGLPANKPVVLFYGFAQAEVPFGAGIRCIAPPFYRVAKIPSSGPTGSISVPLDFTLPKLSSGPGQILAGAPVYFQAWFRDPGTPSGFNSSDAMCVTFAP